MKKNERTSQLRPILLLLSITSLTAWINLTVWISEGMAESNIRGGDSPSPGTVFDPSEIEQMPNINRDIRDILKTAPGISVQEPGEDTVHIGGVTSQRWQDFRSSEDFGDQTPPDFGDLSHEGFKPGLFQDFGLALSYLESYRGWNNPLYQDNLRISGSPLAESSLTPEAISQPEHVTGLSASFFNYKGFGPISMEALGLDYRYTDPSNQQPQATTDQSAATSQATLYPVRQALIHLIVYAMVTNQPPQAIALAIYQKTGNIFLAAETIALTYAMYNLAMWGGEPPTALLADQIIGAALLNTWFLILHNMHAIAYRDAALAMASTVLLLSWNVLQAQAIAMQVLGNFVNATHADRSYVSGVLGFVAARQFVDRDGRSRVQVNYAFLFAPKKGIRPVSLWEQVNLYPILAFFEVWRWFMGPVEPNDPLYMKKGSGKKASAGLRKGLGFLLGAVGAPVSVEDKLADDQWGLHAAGFKPRGTPGSAWDIADGSQKNVVVAVIDSGLDTAHPDGPQYLWTNEDEIPGNGVDDDANGYVDDVHGWNFVGESNDIRDDFGHGTFVAGIIAAKRNNGEGIAGINPGARIMTLKILSEKGSSKSLAVYRAIRYAVDNGARVLNLSIGGRGLSPLEQIGINYAYTMGCIVVVAAGNQSGNIAEFGPPGARRSFSVASMNMDSSRRDASNKGLNVALAAPGESVYSLTAQFEGKRDNRVVPLFAKGYHRLNGTSFAAPFVAATASLIWAKNPALDHRQVEDMILQSAQDIHTPGWDMPTGQGKLDAFAALNQAPDKLLVPRITEFYVNKVKRRIASVDIYGVARGDLGSYIVEVGRGEKPKKWQQVFGPSASPVDYGLICRIDGQHFSKGSKWKVRLVASDKQGKRKAHEVLVSKK